MKQAFTIRNFFPQTMALIAAALGMGNIRRCPSPRPVESVPRRKRSVVTRFGGGSVWHRKYGMSLRDRILEADTGIKVTNLLRELWSYKGANARTERRCIQAAERRHSYLSGLIRCSAPSDSELILAQFSVEIPEGPDNKLPLDIQWAPPGENKIVAKQGDKTVKKTVRVTAKGAANLQAFLTKALEAARRDEGDAPYFDFNHDDKEASAHPTEFYWGGDDPKTGGIRAKLEWTHDGRKAVLGKTYRRFSPAMLLDANGEISGSDINMGGLVNRAAFTRIQPIWSKAGAEDPEQETNNPNTMKTLLAILAKAGLISSPDLDEASAVSQVQTNHAALVAKQADLTGQVTTLTAKNGEINTLLTAQKAENEKLVKASASSAVEAAIATGRIAPKDDTLKAKWVDAYVRDPEGTQAILASLPENPALRTVVKAKAGEGLSSQVGGGTEHEFLVKTKASATENKIPQGDAIMVLAKQEPKLYDAYRESLVVFGKQ